MDWVKKLLVFNQKKDGNITDKEIKSISDKQAQKYLEELPVDSLIDLEKIDKEGNQTFIRKEIFNSRDGFIACIGRPGEGKSSLCSAFYKSLYGVNEEVFSISNAKLSFTKGLWTIKEKERRKIKQNIVKDIIDVEGFQVDDLSTWKYIMIVAFISTDIVIVNRGTRMDDTKKILNIIWNSLEKMNKLGLPRILKTIWIQVKNKKGLTSFNSDMENIGVSLKNWKEKGIKIRPFKIAVVSEDDLEEAEDNILNVEKYIKNVKEVFVLIQEENKGESVSTFTNKIDDFNNALNGKEVFDINHIKGMLKKDVDNYYLIIKNKKERELMNEYKLENFERPNNSSESFEEFIKRNNKINFSFEKKEVIEKLTFYGSSNEFNKIYDQLLEQKEYKADSSIFKEYYDTLIEREKVKEKKERELEKIKQEELDNQERERKMREEIKKSEKRINALNDFEKAKERIKEYYLNLKFYDDIESYSSFKYDINGDYDYNIKNDYNKQLREFYKEKEREKRKDWDQKIERSKFKTAVQCIGDMVCENGCKYSDDGVGCGRCRDKVKYEERLLYWVDGDTHYAICKNCLYVRKMKEDISCTCGAKCKCKVKMTTGYRA